MSVEKTRLRRRHGIVVLSMPRSGPSTLAGLLGEMGCDLPASRTTAGAAGDRLGSRTIDATNDAILASAGSSRDDWRPFDSRWIASPSAKAFLARGREVLDAEYGGSGLLVVEDSPICRLVPFWKKLFKAEGIRPVYALEHRDPAATATALRETEGWPFDYGLLLWMRHALDAEIRTRGRSRIVTSHDLILHDWTGVVDAVAKHGRIVFPRRIARVGPRIDAFLAALPSPADGGGGDAASGPFMSQWIDPVSGILERWARDAEDPKDYKTLDAIRKRFDRTVPLFGTLIETMRNDTGEAARLKAGHDRMIVEMQSALSAEAAAGAALERAHDAILEERDALRRQVEDIDAEKWQIQSELAQRKAQIEDIDGAGPEHDALRKSARLERIRAQGDLQRKLVDAMTTHRRQSDAELARMQAELHGLHEAVKEADNLVEHTEKDRDSLARSLSDHRARMAELEDANAMILNSTSWKLTAPLRRLITLLKR